MLTLGLSALSSQHAVPFGAMIKAMNSLEHTAVSDEAQWDYNGVFFLKHFIYTVQKSFAKPVH